MRLAAIIPAHVPLLHGDETTSDGRRRNFGLVDGDDGGGNADGDTGDDTTSHEHAYVLQCGRSESCGRGPYATKTCLRRALKNAADDPDPAAEDDSPLATEVVGEPGDGEGAGEGASGHGGDDATLLGGARITEVLIVGRVLRA